MYIQKQLGRLKIVLRTNHNSTLELINIGVNRSIGTQYTLCILNVKLVVNYISEKQEKAFNDMCKLLGSLRHEEDEDWGKEGW